MSIDWGNDTVSNDAVHAQRVGENWLLHANPAQKWYYLSAMDEEDFDCVQKHRFERTAFQ